MSRLRPLVPLIFAAFLLVLIPRAMADIAAATTEPTTMPIDDVKFVTLLNLTSVTAVMGATSGIVKLVTAHTVPGTFFGKLPVWVYQVAVALLLTILAYNTGALKGDVLELLQSTALAAIGSTGVYELFRGNTATPVGTIGTIGNVPVAVSPKGYDARDPAATPLSTDERTGYDADDTGRRGFVSRAMIFSMLIGSLVGLTGCAIFTKTATMSPSQRLYVLYSTRATVVHELTTYRKLGYIDDNWALFINDLLKKSDVAAEVADAALSAAEVSGDADAVTKALDAFSAAIDKLIEQSTTAKRAEKPTTQPTRKIVWLYRLPDVLDVRWTSCPVPQYA